MRLTPEEFNRIRPVQWSLKNYGYKVFNTTINQTETKLFWLDFMRLVFAPKFKKQNGITEISIFDLTQPVLITDDLDLLLPTNLETAMYYANNTTLPMKFMVNISKTFILILSIVMIFILIALNIIYGERLNFKNII